MPFKKIANPPVPWHSRRCQHPEHDPPGMIVLPPGTHEWQCPKCHAKQFVTIREPPRCSVGVVVYKLDNPATLRRHFRSKEAVG